MKYICLIINCLFLLNSFAIGMDDKTFNEFEAFKKQKLSLSNESNNLKNLAYYNTYKKSIGVAKAWAFLIPGAGHLYAGDWAKGSLFLIGETITAVAFFDSYRCEGRTSLVCLTKRDINSTQFAISLVLVVALKIWAINDAGYTAKRYNENLMKNLKIEVGLFDLSSIKFGLAYSI